jgi:anti-sigma factor RsiW
MPHEQPDDRPIAAPGSLEEQLVAYLDGELDEGQTAHVEQLLAADPKVRESLLRLDRAWSLLERLDRVRLDDRFTRSTLEMVAVAAEEDVRRWEREVPRQRWRRWLVGGMGLLAASVAGFAMVGLFRPDPDKSLLQDLPVLEDLDELRQVDDITFLQLLYEEGLFAKDAADEA